MKNSLLITHLLLTCLLEINSGNAQYYFNNDKYYAGNIIVETGISAGIMNCFTDLGGKKGSGKKLLKDLNWRQSQLAFSLYAMLIYKDVFAVRLELGTGSLSAADHVLQKTDPRIEGRYGRNLSFKTQIHELQLAVEVHPVFFYRYEENKAPYYSPYLIAGIGYYSFNPKAKLNNHWYSLQPLRLEGQGFAEYKQRPLYKRKQFNFPLGLGIRYEMGPLFNLRLEMLYRILLTDYLDDVSKSYIDTYLFNRYLQPAEAELARQLHNRRSEIQPGYTAEVGSQRGNPHNNDAYFSIQAKIGMIIRKKRFR